MFYRHYIRHAIILPSAVLQYITTSYSAWLSNHLLLISCFYNYSIMSSPSPSVFIALQWFVDSQDLVYIYDVFVKCILRKALSRRLLSFRSSYECYLLYVSMLIRYASLALFWSYFQNSRLVSLDTRGSLQREVYESLTLDILATFAS